MNKKIVRRNVDNVTFAKELPPLLQRIYSARGVQTQHDLERSLETLAPYHQLSNIHDAVAIFMHALRERHHIMIIGDFDADGATSTALAVNCLQKMGAATVSYLVPNRFEFGYGLTPEIVEVAASSKPQLIITVDNGISSCEGVAQANTLNIDVLITDHHLPGQTLPAAKAIVNPNLPGDLFPSKNLAGVGVIFYVMLALRAALRESGWFIQQGLAEPNMADFLDLVALGTVADVVPLDKNNRILVHQGLNRIKQGKVRPGIKALLNVAKKPITKITAADFGFAVAPRLNAAGRLDDMRLGIECLLAENDEVATAIASQLDLLNMERQHIEEGMREQALNIVANLQLGETMPMGICLHDSTWHQGIIGIVAARVKEQLHRPVFAFAPHSGDEWKGSGRSIPGLHLKDVLEQIATEYPSMIKKFGGHAMAAGMSIAQANLNQFTEVFATTVANLLSADDLQGVIHSDGELCPKTLNLDTAILLQEAGPWGQCFPEPIFDGHFKVVNHKILKDKHIKFLLSSLDEQLFIDAIAFNQPKTKQQLTEEDVVHAAYRLDINEYRGNRSLQLLIDYFDMV